MSESLLAIAIEKGATFLVLLLIFVPSFFFFLKQVMSSAQERERRMELRLAKKEERILEREKRYRETVEKNTAAIISFQRFLEKELKINQTIR